MATQPIQLAVDLQTQRPASYPGYVAVLPAFYQGNVKDILVIGLNPSGLVTTAAYSQANLVGYTMEITISATPNGAGTQVIYMTTISLAATQAAGLSGSYTIFTGSLDFTQSNLATAMATMPSIQATIEFEIIGAGGFRQTIYQDTITIFAPANNGAVVVPQPPVNYFTAAQSDARYFQLDSENPGGGFTLLSPDGTKHMFISLSNNGTLSEQLF